MALVSWLWLRARPPEASAPLPWMDLVSLPVPEVSPARKPPRQAPVPASRRRRDRSRVTPGASTPMPLTAEAALPGLLLTDIPRRESPSLAPTLPGATAEDFETRPGDAKQRAVGIVQGLVDDRLRERRPTSNYFGTLRDTLETLWHLDPLLSSRKVDAGQGDTARVRLVQRNDGALLEVSLLAPPRSAELGRNLLADLRAGAATLPPPPPEVLRGRDQFASLWDFRVKPPTGIKLSVEFDAVAIFDKRALPKSTRKAVEFIREE
ncbi:MAG: hypothetical protein ACKVPX_02535 [Myxococcaceae bacterium]